MSLSPQSSDASTYSPSCEAGLQFVVSNSVDKPNAEVRKLIRSHCMLKKNKGKTRRLSKYETNSSANKSTPGEDSSESSTSPASSSDSVIPSKIGSDLLTIRYADAVDSYKVEVVFRCKLNRLPHLSKHIGNCYRAKNSHSRRHTSLFYCQKDVVPFGCLHGFREKGGSMD